MIIKCLKENIKDINGKADELSYAIHCNKLEVSANIDEIIDSIIGENDGANWHWIVRLENNKFAYITGGCDYTGWDCLSSLFIDEYNSLAELLTNLPCDDHSNKNIQEIFKQSIIKLKLKEWIGE